MPLTTVAHACFTACEKSNEFEERDVPLQTKIGRAVARVRAAPDNMIFDCKVLSRTHAVLWYEDEKFYLRDTKSSNGTFVNNVRLSKGGEESAPHEIFSGDIVQLGVDIVENQKKATFSCIIAICKLIHPDGRESVRPENYDSGMSSADGASMGSGSAALSATELFQLHQYIREAAHREQSLRSKLNQLQELLAASHNASDSTWQALIDEDRLLSRIETLESRITLLKKSTTEDKLRDEAEQLLIEKEEYEAKAKESVRKILQEKMEAVQKLTDVERALITTEKQNDRTSEERDAAKNMFLTLDEKFNELQTKHDIQEKELARMRAQHGDAEKTTTTLKDENVTLKMREMSLNDRVKELLTQLEEKLAAKENDESSSELHEQIAHREEELASVKATLVEVEAKLTAVRGEMSDRVDRMLNELPETVKAVCKRVLLPYASSEKSEDTHSIDSNESGASLASEQAQWIEGAIEQLTTELVAAMRPPTAGLNESTDSSVIAKQLELIVDSASLAAGETVSTAESSPGSSPTAEYVRMENELTNAVNTARVNEQALFEAKSELHSMTAEHSASVAAAATLRTQLTNVQTLLEQNETLTAQLRMSLTNEKATVEKLQKEMRELQDELSASKSELITYQQETEQVRKQLATATEARIVQEEVEKVRASPPRPSASSKMDEEQMETMIRANARTSAELQAITQQKEAIEQRHAKIAAEHKTAQSEIRRLEGELRASVEASSTAASRTTELEKTEQTWRQQANAFREEAEQARKQTTELNSELRAARAETSSTAAKLHELQSRVDRHGDGDTLHRVYGELKARCENVTLVSGMCLFILFISIVMAFNPFLSFFTATNDEVVSSAPPVVSTA